MYGSLVTGKSDAALSYINAILYASVSWIVNVYTVFSFDKNAVGFAKFK